jgi:enoyl-CoA hydratase/carnithine racemase
MKKTAEEGVIDIMVNGMITSLIDLEKPLIALVRGATYGIACTILGLADFIYCSPDAIFCTPFMDTF